MSILPRPPVPTDEHGDPPAVASWRDRIADSRAAAWAKGHKTVAAVLAGLWVVVKSWRWLLFDLWHAAAHPGRSASWVGGHLVLLLAVSGAVFAVVALSARLGLDRLFADADARADGEIRGAARLDRARDEATLRR